LVLLNDGTAAVTEGEGGASSVSTLKLRLTVGVTDGSQHANEQRFFTILGFGQGDLDMLSSRRLARLCAVFLCGNK